jgi:hypothetical protein
VKHRLIAGIAVALSLAAAASAQAAQPAADRAGLFKLAQSYLDGMARHSTAGLPLAADIKSTENGVAMPVGQGLWTKLSTIGKTQMFADAGRGQVGLYAAATEPSGPVVFLVRLKVDAGKISESEIIVARHGRLPAGEENTPAGKATLARGDQASAFNAEGIGLRNDVYEKPLAPGDRKTRAQLITAGNGYFESVHRHKAELAPFAQDCARFENGAQTTSVPNSTGNKALTCGQSVEALIHIGAVRDRRFPLVDEERGLVWGFASFDVPGGKTSSMVDGKPYELPAFMREPRSFILGELFKVVDGELKTIEVVMVDRPLGAPLGWPAY